MEVDETFLGFSASVSHMQPRNGTLVAVGRGEEPAQRPCAECVRRYTYLGSFQT